MDEATLSARPGRSSGTCTGSVKLAVKWVSGTRLGVGAGAGEGQGSDAARGKGGDAQCLVTTDGGGLTAHLRHRRLDEGIVQGPVSGPSALHSNISQVVERQLFSA